MLILLQRASANVPNPPAGKSTLFVDTNGNFNVLNSNGGYGSFNGSFVAIGNVDLGPVGNIFIADGSNGQVLKSYGANGHVYWDTDSATPGGSNTQIQFNDAGSLGGNTGFTFDKTTGALSITGNISAGNVGATTFTGALSGAATTAGTVTTAAQPNITSVGTLTSLSVTGNVAAGNILTDNLLYANGTAWDMQQPGGTNTQVQYNNNDNFGASSAFTFDSGTNTLTATNIAGTTVSVVGNVTGANLFTGGFVSATGNVTGAFFIGNGSQLTGIDATTIQNGTANVRTFNNANVTVSSNGNANILVVTGTGANINGTLSATGNVTGANLFTSGSVDATGNINATGNVSAGNIGTTGNVSAVNINATGNVLATTGEIKSNIANITNLLVANVITASGNANVGNIGAATGIFTTVSVSGNLTVGNIVSSGTGGNISGANVISANLFTGTLTTAAQPNITSTGTLTSLAVTGTATAGNLSTGGTLSATGNIVSAANVVTDLIVGRTQSVSITATGSNQNINLTPTGTGTVNVGNFIISNVATPVNSTDAATKQYVDDVAQGLHTHDSCNAATTTTLASISGGTVTYNNGTSGVGATLTTTGSFTTIDGVTLSNGMRILVKDEATAANNGIYVRTSSTVLTRADDFDTPTEMAGGDFTFVTAGTVYDNTGWVMPDAVTTVGTSPVVWVQFSGAGTYTAGTGLALNGSVFSIANTTVVAGAYGNGDYNATFTVNSQGQLSAAANVAITANAGNLSGTVLKSTVVTSSLTSVGTLTTLSISGNANIGNVGAAAGVFTSVSGNGSSLSSITGANVTGAVAFATTANAVAGANVSGQVGNALVAGTVYTGAQGNITSLGTLSSLSVSGNANVGNIGATNLVGTLTTGSQTNITAVGTLASLSVSGNANVGNIGAGSGIYTTLSASGNVTGGNLVSTGQLGGTGATHLGNTFTTGANTTAGTVTGNFALSAGSRFQATYA
jgi:hypothetical protein